MNDHTCDIVIIGAGIAGASLASELAPHVRVNLLEMEDQAGYHTTGRSAATWIEGYGNEAIRGLNRASFEFLNNPPQEFSENSFLSPRGMMLIEHDESKSLAADIARDDATVKLISADEACQHVEKLHRSRIKAAVYTQAAFDIDVNALHMAHLRKFKADGGVMHLKTRVEGIEPGNGGWRVKTSTGEFSCDIVVNASGAWAGQIGELAGSSCQTGLTPLRRSAAIVPLPDTIDCSRWPITADVDEAFYFKPEAGQLMVSPADETPQEPHDAYPEDYDVALGVDRFQRLVDVPVTRLGRTWAGLRTFASDRTPVVGFDPSMKGFFWLAGQGGYGIQTSPAMAQLAASVLLDKTMPKSLLEQQFDRTALDPVRFL